MPEFSPTYARGLVRRDKATIKEATDRLVEATLRAERKLIAKEGRKPRRGRLQAREIAKYKNAIRSAIGNRPPSVVDYAERRTRNGYSIAGCYCFPAESKMVSSRDDIDSFREGGWKTLRFRVRFVGLNY